MTLDEAADELELIAQQIRCGIFTAAESVRTDRIYALISSPSSDLTFLLRDEEAETITICRWPAGTQMSREALVLKRRPLA